MVGVQRKTPNTEEGDGCKILRGGSFAGQYGRIHSATNRPGCDPNQAL